MSYALCEHESIFDWVCLTSSIFYTMGTPATSHCWIILGKILNWPLCTFCHVWFHIVGAVPVSAEPVRMVSRVGSAPPSLQNGVEHTYCLYYGLLYHNIVHGGSLPVGVLLAGLDFKWGFLFIPPVRIISTMKSSSCIHESHWSLFPWILIRCFCRS